MLEPVFRFLAKALPLGKNHPCSLEDMLLNDNFKIPLLSWFVYFEHQDYNDTNRQSLPNSEPFSTNKNASKKVK
jgi:hypothetical protein